MGLYDELATLAAAGDGTGPRTSGGKSTSSRNACKGSHSLILHELSRTLTVDVQQARNLVEGVEA